MRVAYVIRLDPVELDAGQIKGEVEEVATGRLAALRSTEDLLSFWRSGSAQDGALADNDHGGEK